MVAPNETRAAFTKGLVPCAGSRDVYHRPERVASCEACRKRAVEGEGADRPLCGGGELPLADTGRAAPSIPRPRAGEASERKSSPLEAAFDAAREAAGIPPHDEAEFVFAPPRKFRADRAWLGPRVLVELNGGVWARGGAGHSHPMWIERDAEKARLAAAHGYRVFPVTTKALNEDRASVFDALREALERRSA